MLHLRPKTGGNVRKRQSAHTVSGGTKATKVTLLRFNVTAKPQPSSFVHCLGKQDLGAYPLGDGFVICNRAEATNRRSPFLHI